MRPRQSARDKRPTSKHGRGSRSSCRFRAVFLPAGEKEKKKRKERGKNSRGAGSEQLLFENIIDTRYAQPSGLSPHRHLSETPSLLSPRQAHAQGPPQWAIKLSICPQHPRCLLFHPAEAHIIPVSPKADFTCRSRSSHAPLTDRSSFRPSLHFPNQEWNANDPSLSRPCGHSLDQIATSDRHENLELARFIQILPFLISNYNYITFVYLEGIPGGPPVVRDSPLVWGESHLSLSLALLLSFSQDTPTIT
ncbi:hypothetical protein VUR80DRAFT_7248 [Thermomyces stellatus]